jgi:hypothetical protein
MKICMTKIRLGKPMICLPRIGRGVVNLQSGSCSEGCWH